MDLTTALVLVTAQVSAVGTFIYGVLVLVIPLALAIAGVLFGFRWLMRFLSGRRRNRR